MGIFFNSGYKSLSLNEKTLKNMAAAKARRIAAALKGMASLRFLFGCAGACVGKALATKSPPMLTSISEAANALPRHL
jgi:hypothetical protein